MNRVIKFRAWDKEENKMINNVVPFFNSDGKLECLVFGYSFGGYDFIEVELDRYEHIFTDPEFDERFVLMQYTGLKDKNGVEIYEGDIVQIKDHSFQKKPGDYTGIEIDGFYPVTYTERMELVAGQWLLMHQLSYITVVGNIYENPELLDGV